VEDAPDMMTVVLPDLDCSLLYANEVVGEEEEEEEKEEDRLL
jgi:hypothetical protein